MRPAFATCGPEQYLDAQICCQQALAIDPGHAETLHLMGLLSLHREQYDHAVEWISRALKQDSKAEYLYSLGTALRQQGRLEDALMAFDKAVQLKPDKAELWIGLGRVLGDLKRPADALLSFQHALKLNPRHWDAAQESGAALCVLERAEEALPYFMLCMELRPNHAATLTSLTRCLLGLKRLDEALIANQRAYARDPGNADACDNLGIILERLGREEEALTWLDRALALRPDFIDTLNNRALVLGKLHRFDEAVGHVSSCRDARSRQRPGQIGAWTAASADGRFRGRLVPARRAIQDEFFGGLSEIFRADVAWARKTSKARPS